MSTQVSISDASNILGVSDKTIRRWIESGKLTAEKNNGRWMVDVDDQDDVQVVYPNIQVELIETLKGQVEDLKSEIEQKNQQIERQGEQIDHMTQLLAVSQRSIVQLTEQNQLLLEDNRKKPFWRRWFSRG